MAGRYFNAGYLKVFQKSLKAYSKHPFNFCKVQYGVLWLWLWLCFLLQCMNTSYNFFCCYFFSQKLLWRYFSQRTCCCSACVLHILVGWQLLPKTVVNNCCKWHYADSASYQDSSEFESCTVVIDCFTSELWTIGSCGLLSLWRPYSPYT